MFTPLYEGLKGRALVGLVRVSTGRQGLVGLSLEEQSAAIRAVFAESGGQLLGIFGEPASGMSDRGGLSNPELWAALKVAKTQQALVVVTEVSRLGRSESVADLIDQHGVQVWVIKLGRVATLAELRKGLRAAENKGLDIRRRAKASHVRTNLTVRDDTDPGRQSSHRAASLENKSRGDQLAEHLAEILKKHDRDGTMTAREVAVLLLRLGVRTRRGNLFNKDRIRRCLRRARSIVRDDAAVDDDLEGPMFSL